MLGRKHRGVTPTRCPNTPVPTTIVRRRAPSAQRPANLRRAVRGAGAVSCLRFSSLSPRCILSIATQGQATAHPTPTPLPPVQTLRHKRPRRALASLVGFGSARQSARPTPLRAFRLSLREKPGTTESRQSTLRKGKRFLGTNTPTTPPQLVLPNPPRLTTQLSTSRPQ